MISRGSGRSAVGAAAYRSGEKLRSHSVGTVAYRAGEEIRDDDGEIVHDYTKRNGVVHKEIILPDGAPKEYKDRQTLWNAVEKREKRHDAQLAREINVALAIGSKLEEQKALLREYIKEKFVDKGMIADFAIHHTRAENPHAHIMLTTRTVTPEGFGNKNREWNSRQILVEWR
jgi:ATP-dependent exoDNAse (exonuclease V) alpha subunit